MFLYSCSDNGIPDDTHKEAPNYVTINVSAQRTTTGGSPSGGEEGDGSETGEDRESKISKITILFYQKPADGLSINTSKEKAGAIPVRAFCWSVHKEEETEGDDMAGADPTEIYTTGVHALPDDMQFGQYEVLVIANADLTEELDNKSLAAVRDYVYTREPFDRNDISTSAHDVYQPSKYTDFLLSSVQPAQLIVGNYPGHRGTGTQFDPFTPTTNPIPLERLASRIDFVPDNDGSHWNAADSTYDYPVYDAADNIVATFKLKYCCPFNLTQREYLFKHTTTLKDTTTTNYCGRETSETVNGLRYGTNYVIDPFTYSHNNEELVGDFFYPDLYHRYLTQNMTALKARFPVKSPNDLQGPDENNRKYYILGYSSENTHIYHVLADNTMPYSSYLAGIRIYGRYVLKGQTYDEGRDVPFDWYIRHNAPDGRADISRPLCFALVRNNIYRIYINKIHSVDGDFNVQFRLNVVPWQRYEHSDINM